MEEVAQKELESRRVEEQERELLRWVAPARPFKRRDRQFFTTVIVIVGLVGIILMFAREWMLIATLAALVFAYYVWSTVPPEDIEYVVTNRGLRLHGQLYKWAEMDRWWMEEKWGQKMVAVDFPVSFPKRLFLLLGTTEEGKVKEVLDKYVMMERPTDTAMDKAGKWLAEKFPLER